MKYSATLSLSALVAAALAVPAEVVARTGSGGGGTPPSTCNNDQQQVCCASVVGLFCLIDIFGGNCNGGTYCCDGGCSAGGLINVDVLNCVDILLRDLCNDFIPRSRVD